MDKLNQLHWSLILGMGALALIRPLMNITGLMAGLGRPFAPILITVLISAAWLAIVVFVRARQPVLTLVFTGIAYGVFALILGTILSPILTGELSGPLANPVLFPFALVSIVVTNALWGFVIGLLAWAIGQINHPKSL